MVSTRGNRRHLIQGESRWSFKEPELLPKDHQHFGFVLFLFLFYIGVQLIDNVVFISGIQQSNLIIYIYVSILFPNLILFRLLQDIEQSSLY